MGDIFFNVQPESEHLDRLRGVIGADTKLADALAAITDAEAFVAATVAAAAARGLPLDGETVRQAIRPDPLGLSRFRPATPTATHWPSAQWLPVHVAMLDQPATVAWAHVGPAPLTEPFYEGSVRRALLRPFNRLIRCSMTLDDFIAGAPPPLSPDGFIFHMSRCGSTLLAQMLAESPRNIVISEAAPIDAAVQAHHLPPDSHVALLRAMIAAFGRRRSGIERRFFVKLDSWHALALPLFRHAFPAVPWVFLYRDPLEVMVSQMRQPGAQMVPQLVAPRLYGLDPDAIPGPDYTARALASICAAVARHLPGEHGIAVNYRDLPGAVESLILPHFGAACDDAERETLRRAAQRDAKQPHLPFAADGAAKRAEASPALRALTERHLGALIRQLDARTGPFSEKTAGLL